jgi:hypothetical protein
MNGNRWSAWLPDLLALLIILLTFSNVGFRNLEQPGLYEDEAWGATHAVKLAAGSPVIEKSPYGQVTLFGKPWPFMRAAYIGPVKSYILGASFSLFGVSIPVLRATTSFLGLLMLLALYGLLRQEFGRFVAFSAAMLLATDLTFVLAVRSDWGPIAFSLLATTAAAWALLRWVRRPDTLIAPAAAGLLLGLGLSHKLDFLAPAAAVSLAFLCVWRTTCRRCSRGAALLLVFFVIGASPVITYNFLTQGESMRLGKALATQSHRSFPPGMSDLASVGRDYTLVSENVRDLLGGLYMPNWILGNGTERLSRFGLPLTPKAFVFAPFLLALFVFPPLAAWRPPVLFFLLSFSFTVLFLALTPMARGPHHFLLAYPLPHALLGVALGVPWLATGSARFLTRAAARSLSVSLLLLLLIPQIALERAFLAKLSHDGGRGYWSAEAMGSLVATVERSYPRATLTLLDWGFEQPLILLGRDRYSIDAAYWRVLAAPNRIECLAGLVRESNRVFIVHSRDFTAFKPVLEGLEELSRAQGLIPEETKIFERDGRHFASVLAFAAPGAS